MAKWYGVIGFGIDKNMGDGIWYPDIVEKNYYGEVLKNTRRFQSANQVNDNIVLSNEISIVADPFANENFHFIRYVEYMGTKWKITNIEVQYPRLILTLGEVYNG